MQRRLIVMRHAKSDWSSGASSDHARPLNARGRHDAPRVARRLLELDWVPDRALSSTAERTRETWALMASELGRFVDVVFLDPLYLAGADALRAALDEVPDELGTVLALGHNPGWEEAGAWFTGQHVGLTTANALLLEGEGDSWAEAAGAPGNWRLVEHVRPRDLEG